MRFVYLRDDGRGGLDLVIGTNSDDITVVPVSSQQAVDLLDKLMPWAVRRLDETTRGD